MAGTGQCSSSLCALAGYAQIVWEANWRISKPSRTQLQVGGFLAGCGILLLVQEGYGFKILMDEVMAPRHVDEHAFRQDRPGAHARRTCDFAGSVSTALGPARQTTAKLHPFLVSVLHDLTGYRPENVFVLNTALTFILLGLTYAVARRLAGRGAGIVAVLLLTGLPLLAQNATGGGFELLNAVLILGTLLLEHQFRRDQRHTHCAFRHGGGRNFSWPTRATNR